MFDSVIQNDALCGPLRHEFGRAWLEDRLARLARLQRVFGAHFPVQAGDLLARWAAAARTARGHARMAPPAPHAPAGGRARHGRAGARRHLPHPRPTDVHRR